MSITGELTHTKFVVVVFKSQQTTNLNSFVYARYEEDNLKVYCQLLFTIQLFHFYFILSSFLHLFDEDKLFYFINALTLKGGIRNL